jgi:hypothetical protein
VDWNAWCSLSETSVRKWTRPAPKVFSQSPYDFATDRVQFFCEKMRRRRLNNTYLLALLEAKVIISMQTFDRLFCPQDLLVAGNHPAWMRRIYLRLKRFGETSSPHYGLKKGEAPSAALHR